MSRTVINDGKMDCLIKSMDDLKMKYIISFMNIQFMRRMVVKHCVYEEYIHLDISTNKHDFVTVRRVRPTRTSM